MLSVGFRHLMHTCRIVTHVEFVPGSTDGQKRHFKFFQLQLFFFSQNRKSILLRRPGGALPAILLERRAGEDTKGSTERMGRIIDFLPSSTGILAPAASSKFKSSSNSSSRHDVHGREDRIYPVARCYSTTHQRYHQSRHSSPSEGSESSFDVRELDAALKAEYHPQHECPARSSNPRNNSPKTRRKHVRFDTVSDGNTIPIARRKDIPKSERKELWYTRSDYRRIREEHKEMCLKQQQQQQQQTFISHGQPEKPNDMMDDLEFAVLQESMHHHRHHHDAYARQRRELHRSMATGVVLRQHNNNAQQLASQYIDIVRRTRHACFISSLIAQTHRSIRGGDSSRAALIIN